MWYKDLLFSLKETLENGEYYTRQINPFALIVLTTCILLTLGIKCSFRKPFRKNRKLGERPIHELHGEKQLLREIHYAVSRCGVDPDLIKRCIALLRKFPAAVNLPLHADRYTPLLVMTLLSAFNWPYQRACYVGCPELIANMLQIGADVKAKSSMGDNAFYLATDSILSGRCNTFAPLKLLISAGVDVNGCRAGGYTALHLAAARGHDAVVRWLLSCGVDPAPRTAAISPHRLAIRYGHLTTAALLQVTADGAE